MLHIFHEIGMQVVCHAADHVVVDDESSAGGLLKDFQDFLAVAESVEECGGGAEVLAETAEEKDVAVDTLELVHDGADDLHAFADLDAHSLFDAHTECMAGLHGSEVVHTVGEGESLGIGKAFADFLDTAVDVSEVRVNLLDAFAFDGCAEVEHTVCRGVLWTDVHHIGVVGKHGCVLALEFAVGIEGVFVASVADFLVGAGDFGVFLLGFVVLTHGESHPVFAEEETSHVGMSEEDDAVEVIDFAFVDVCDVPKVAYGGECGALLVCGHTLYVCHLERGARLGEAVNHTETFFAPVATGEALEEVVSFGFQCGESVVEFFRSHHDGVDHIAHISQ